MISSCRPLESCNAGRFRASRTSSDRKRGPNLAAPGRVQAEGSRLGQRVDFGTRLVAESGGLAQEHAGEVAVAEVLQAPHHHTHDAAGLPGGAGSSHRTAVHEAAAVHAGRGCGSPAGARQMRLGY